jgi:hypothetical protein
MNSVRAIHGQFVHHKNKRIHLKSFWSVVLGTTEITMHRLREKVLLESIWIRGGGYINPCGPLSVCCTICFCCLDVRYGNTPKKVNTIILLNRTIRSFLLHAKTFLDTSLLRFDSMPTGSNNPTTVSGPLLVTQAQFNVSYYVFTAPVNFVYLLRGSLSSYSYFSFFLLSCDRAS